MSAVHTGGALAVAIEALLPGMCPHCDHPLAGSDRGLCSACWAMTVPRAGDACPFCGTPSDTSSEPCLACIEDPPPQQGTVIWGEHAGVLRTAVLALKHGGRDDLAAPLGQRLAAKAAVEAWVDDIDSISSVPSHPWRRLRRPWTASELLALEVARQLGKPVGRFLRRRGLGRQTGRTRSQRLDMPRRSFSAPAKVEGHCVLLIDDVTTTGTTLRRASRALQRAGAEAVFCGVVAHTPVPRRFS